MAEDIGSRLTGTEAERQAANYIARKLASWGYDVDRQPFNFEAFIDLGSSLEVLSPEDLSLAPLTLYLSPAGEVEGEVVAAGLGRPQEFPTDTAGKIALIERGAGLPFSEKVSNAAAAGAVAAVIFNDEPGPLAGALEEMSQIPAVGISQEEGQRLLALLVEGPVAVRLDVRTESGPRSSQNVIARSPDGGCQFMVGGHYDSVAAGPGANDNASGTAVVLEVARVLSETPAEEEVCFVAFGAEEVGLIGSQQLVSALPVEERRALEAVINLDMVGVGERWLLGGSSSLTDVAAAEAETMGLEFTVSDLPEGKSSDHASFIAASIPALLIHAEEDPRYHTAGDQAQFVEPALLEEAGQLALAILEVLSQAS